MIEIPHYHPYHYALKSTSRVGLNPLSLDPQSCILNRSFFIFFGLLAYVLKKMERTKIPMTISIQDSWDHAPVVISPCCCISCALVFHHAALCHVLTLVVTSIFHVVTPPVLCCCTLSHALYCPGSRDLAGSSSLAVHNL